MDLQHTTCAYLLTFPGGKVYIGITTNLKNRLAEHRKRARAGYSQPIYDAIRRFGLDSAKVDVLIDGLTRDQANEVEQDLIAKYESRDQAKGYNVAAGGRGARGVIASPETRRKQSLARKGHPSPRKGKPAGYSPETLARMSAAASGPRSSRWGKKFTEAEKEQSILQQTTRKQIVCVDTGDVFPSIRHAARTLGLSPRNIAAVVAGRAKTTGGLRFRLFTAKEG